MKKVLLFGRDGQVGWELNRLLGTVGELHAFNRAELDLTDERAVSSAVRSLEPSVIVNAAAYTAVDKAETDRDQAWRLNAEVPKFLASLAKEQGALLVHYSTDYVFDGSARLPYLESAPAAPLGVYGASKWAGEEGIRNSGAKHLIFRTSWVYASRGKNFLLTMLDLAGKKSSLSIVADQRGTPTWAHSIAEATIKALQAKNVGELSGTYHMTCSGETSWYGFARAIFSFLEEQEMGPIPTLVPISTADYPTAAKRPSYSVLDNHSLQNAFGINLIHWQSALESCLFELLAIKGVSQ